LPRRGNILQSAMTTALIYRLQRFFRLCPFCAQAFRFITA
jgi:hypothetical protein